MDRSARKENTRYIIALQTSISLVGLLLLIVFTILNNVLLNSSYKELFKLGVVIGFVCIGYGAITPTIIVVVRNFILRKKGKYL